MTKFALPTLFILIFALFYFSVTSRPPEAPPQVVDSGPRPSQIADFEKSVQDRAQSLAKELDDVRAELKLLSETIKTNSEKIAAVALGADAQGAKPTNSDKAAQVALDQVNTLRSEQDKLLKDAKEGAERTARALRQEIAANRENLNTQLGEALRGQTNRSEALSQRLEATKTDIDTVKKSLDEDRQNASNISPGLALVVALAALVLGPLVARQFTANQLAAAKKEWAANIAAAQPPIVKTDEANLRTASHDATDPQDEVSLQGEAPKFSEETVERPDSDARHDSEKV
ncbi:MAG: hypothetical protein ACREEK_07310 [Bradyrhizobium sp.]